MKPLRIALTKGRLERDTVGLFEEMGLDCSALREKGRKLIEVVPQEMRSPQTTGKWEKGLSSIAKGKMTEERFMASIRRYVQFLIQDAASDRKSVV